MVRNLSIGCPVTWVLGVGAVVSHIHLMSVQEGTDVLPSSHAAAVALPRLTMGRIITSSFPEPHMGLFSVLFSAQPFCNPMSGMTSHCFRCIRVAECNTHSEQGIKKDVSAKRPLDPASICLPGKLASVYRARDLLCLCFHCYSLKQPGTKHNSKSG